MFTSAVLKLNAWCNLNCTYCYMFNQADDTYQRVPKNMSPTVANDAIDQIIRHCSRHALRQPFDITLHGGEPSLWPVDYLSAFLARTTSEARTAGVTLNISMQTNGYRLRRDLIEVLGRHGVSVGISLDGPAEYNDARRLTQSGRGSYARVIETASSLVSFPNGPKLAGFLCVADPTIPPQEFLEWVTTLPVQRVDVLWPMHYNYSEPPWASVGLERYLEKPLFGEWFASLFEQWWMRDDPDIYIRSFRQLVEIWLGSKCHVDALVNDHMDLVVVNTDGEYEYADYFRGLVDGACRSGFNVAEHGLDDLASDPVFAYSEQLGAHLPRECVGCEVVDVCGGGFLPGRLKEGEQVPRSKSVLCFDQYYFFTRARTLFDAAFAESGIDPVKASR